MLGNKKIDQVDYSAQMDTTYYIFFFVKSRKGTNDSQEEILKCC